MPLAPLLAAGLAFIAHLSLAPILQAADEKPFTQQDLEKIVTETIKDKDTAPGLNTNTYEVDGGQLKYWVNTGLKYNPSPVEHDLPLLFPLAWEFTAQLLKPAKGDEEVWKAAWEKPLAAIREVEQKQLDMIRDYRDTPRKDPEKLKSRLQMLNAVAYEAMTEGYEALAKKRKLEPVEMSQDDFSPPLAVLLVPKPDDEKDPPAIYCLPSYFYRRAKAAGKLDWGAPLNLSPTDNGRQTELQGGSYYFRAVWADGSVSDDVKQDINKPDLAVKLPKKPKQ
jgi:hypothetical protein